MKVAFVFPPMWSPHGDGALQIWNQEVTTRLSRQSEVLVYSGLFSFRPHDSVDGVSYRRFSTPLGTFVKNNHYRLLKLFPLIRYALGVQHPIFSSDLWYPDYALQVARDLRKQGCDIVHVHYYPQVAHVIKRLNPTLPVVLHVHGEWLTQVKFNNLNARLHELDRVITISEYCTKLVRAMFPEIASRCRTSPMGLSPDAFSGADRSFHSSNSGPKLLYVGRISPEKGLHVLLDAFELIIREYPDASLTIVGPESVASRDMIVDLCLKRAVADSLAPFYKGSYLSQLKQKLSPEAAKRVTFTGSVSHSDVPRYYEEADIYISPSFYESFGMAIIEAMAAGVPMVAAQGGAVADLVSDRRTGLLVEAGSPVAIRDAVITLFTNTTLRNSISCAAREMVLKQFSWETICAELVQMYGEVLGNKAAGLTEFDRETIPV
ncbi:MAG: glycosyltransferase family 4 protein [Acidobacteriia bacterium]|nr:glycosyltransferase family 4 protein [Terriglobia bacterium]